MTIRHLPRLDPERWYVIETNHGRHEGRPSWQHRRMSLHGPKVEASAEWNLLGKHGFGVGFQLGRNGMESDLGLDVYLSRLGSLWLRIRAPWTRWARVSQERDPSGWYHARHTGVRLFPHRGCWARVEIEARDGYSSRTDPWWREMSLTPTLIFGRRRTETIEGDSGVARIPMPEGVYVGTWTEKITVSRHVRPLGTWRDRLLGPRRHRSVWLKVDGGIPCEGKGENSWDCGMDGVFGISGATLEEAVGNMVAAVLRDRERYGGPHDLDRPMTVAEAEAREAQR